MQRLESSANRPCADFFILWNGAIFMPKTYVVKERMISVVIPAHNEADEIGELLKAFSAFEGLELIIAEDSSTDETLTIVQEFASQHSNVLLTTSRTLTGKGAAVKRGLALASGDVLGFIDADGSIHPREFMRVADGVNRGADLAFGSRDLADSVIVRAQPLSRRVFGSIYRFLARELFDINVRDFQCGCKAFRRDVWNAVDIACDGFAFDAELIAKAHSKGFTIAEVPITWSNKSNSKVSIAREAFSMLMSLLKTRAAMPK
jgi:glycosyltransferase involved in cell wall biosynthesis